MSATPVIAIFDVGKTNKKLFLFDENYNIVFERSASFIETVDEDGFPCENLESLKQSVNDSLAMIFNLAEFNVKAVNISAYGASFVNVGADGEAITPLYNYLKPYPEAISNNFYAKYGGAESFSADTASPVLGNLNSGLQLYLLKMEKPELFAQLKYALHLPQYLSFLLTGQYYSDLTSIGCHTALWNFSENKYHQWVEKEGIALKLAPIAPGKSTFPAIFRENKYLAGIGLHDSSAALIPYLLNFQEPFVLISTGTWCISLNPFDHSPLTFEQLKADCLCYITFQGKPVKASRLFSGYIHEKQCERIAEHFNQSNLKYKQINYDAELIRHLEINFEQGLNFEQRDLHNFKDDVEAYHQLILDLVALQFKATQMVLAETNVKRIFVDGGFSKNSIFMHLLAATFPETEVFAASMAQASAVGAALAIHQAWNHLQIPSDIIELKYYSSNKAISK